MNLSCRKATELLSAEQDRDLSFSEWASLRAHLAICRGCRAVSEQLKLVRRALQQLFEERR